MSREINMWAAVLHQAIDDLNMRPRKQAEVLWKADAKRWLKSDSEEALSFRWVCMILDLDYQKTRQAISSREGGGGSTRNG